jgi:hypothetical protein
LLCSDQPDHYPEYMLATALEEGLYFVDGPSLMQRPVVMFWHRLHLSF